MKVLLVRHGETDDNKNRASLRFASPLSVQRSSRARSTRRSTTAVVSKLASSVAILDASPAAWTPAAAAICAERARCVGAAKATLTAQTAKIALHEFGSSLDVTPDERLRERARLDRP